MPRANRTDFLNLFLQDVPLLDVRADVEFIKGAFPKSTNVPILNDEQRCLIGTCYKEKGQDAAIALGYELATPEIKASRIKAWKEFSESHPEGYLYCFRGGLRSRITQAWLKEAKIDYPLVVGGYKAMRTSLIEELDKNVQNLSFVMLGGRTASGKTHVLKKIQHFVDLEKIANHRGSSFGAVVTDQPSQINFENDLSIQLLKHRESHSKPIFIEHEGRRIGQRVLPLAMHEGMTGKYPLIILETPMSERVEVCLQDYIRDLYPTYKHQYGELAHDKFSDKILKGLHRIKNRLGGDRHKVIENQLKDALELFKTGDESGFKLPMESLLRDYYDPMYDYQISKRKERIIFKGSELEVLDWAKNYNGESHVE